MESYPEAPFTYFYDLLLTEAIEIGADISEKGDSRQKETAQPAKYDEWNESNIGKFCVSKFAIVGRHCNERDRELQICKKKREKRVTI